MKRGIADPIAAIFGANLVEYWDASDAVVSGFNVSSLTGRLAGVQLTPSGGEPQFGLVDSMMGSKPSIQVFKPALLRNMSLPATLLPAGSRPCMWIIGYISGVPTPDDPGDWTIMSLRQSLGNWDLAFRILDDNDSNLWYQRFWDGVSSKNSYGPSAANMMERPFVMASLLHDDNEVGLWLNKLYYSPQASVGTAAPAAIDRLVLGANGIGTEGSYVTFALAGVTRDAPDLNQLSALYTYAQDNYGVPTNPAEIFGSNLAEYWDAEDAVRSGSNVTSLPGRVAGVTLSKFGAGAGPLYNAADLNLGGKPSINTSASNLLQNASLPAGFVAAGNRPCMWAIGYLNAVPNGANTVAVIFDYRQTAATWFYEARAWYLSAVSSIWAGRHSDGTVHTATMSSTPVAGTPFVIATVNDTLTRIRFGNAYGSATAAAGNALAADLSTITIGGTPTGTLPANMTFTQAGICRNAPTAAELTKLYQYAKAIYGVP